MIKVSSHVSGTVCGGVSESAGLEKTDVKQTGAGNETQYLAFIALKNITVGREHPPEPRERQRNVPDYAIPGSKDRQRDIPAYAISEPKEPRDFPAYAVHEPRDKGDKW